MIVTLSLLFVTMLVAFLLTIDERRAALDPRPVLPRGGPHAVLFFGSSHTVWSAIDLGMRPLEPRDDVDPRWIPPPVKRNW